MPSRNGRTAQNLAIPLAAKVPEACADAEKRDPERFAELARSVNDPHMKSLESVFKLNQAIWPFK